MTDRICDLLVVLALLAVGCWLVYLGCFAGGGWVIVAAIGLAVGTTRLR